MDSEGKPYQGNNAYSIIGEHVLQTKNNIDKNNYMCYACDKEFVKVWDYKRHMENHDEKKSWLRQPKSYHCSLCDKYLLSFYKLNFHKKSHSLELLYQCIYCDRVFSANTYLERHMKTHTQNYQCGQCRKYYTTGSYLDIHTKKHIGETSYQSSQCSTDFPQNSILKYHQRPHTTNKSNQNSKKANLISISTRKEKEENNHIKINDMIFRIDPRNSLTKTKQCTSEWHVIKTRTLAAPGINIFKEAINTNISYPATTTKLRPNNVIRNREQNATPFSKTHVLIDKILKQNTLVKNGIKLKTSSINSNFSKGQAKLNIAKESGIQIKTCKFEENEPHLYQNMVIDNMIETQFEVKKEQIVSELYETSISEETKVEIKDEPIDKDGMDYDCMIKPKIKEIEDSIGSERNDCKGPNFATAEDEFDCENSNTAMWIEPKVEESYDVIAMKTEFTSSGNEPKIEIKEERIK